MWTGDYPRTRGNYVTNSGNTYYDQSDLGSDPAGIVSGKYFFLGAPFSVNKIWRVADISDGLSVTLMMSEAVCPSTDEAYDVRGDIINQQAAAGQFMTLYGPNSSVTEHAVCYGPNFSAATNDPSPCISDAWDQPSSPDPAKPDFFQSIAVISARSRHPGLVNALRCDGSVSSVSETINLRIWRALGSTRGGEAISE
jgi:prepilin-type processing-associated H-X9-DG protein